MGFSGQKDTSELKNGEPRGEKTKVSRNICASAQAEHNNGVLCQMNIIHIKPIHPFHSVLREYVSLFL